MVFLRTGWSTVEAVRGGLLGQESGFCLLEEVPDSQEMFSGQKGEVVRATSPRGKAEGAWFIRQGIPCHARSVIA